MFNKPLMVDLFCGLGGWAAGGLAEGYYVVGFDIERHEYGEHRYPARLVIQDVLTLHGSQFKNAALIVASPPCQGYSYRAMPWKRAKALPPPDNTLFEACFRIQREACEAAGRHIPLVVENVRGAQKWVGRARWNFGSFYLWGDVPALMPPIRRVAKVPGLTWSGSDKPGYVARGFNRTAEQRLHVKVGDAGWRERGPGRQLQDKWLTVNGLKGIPHRTAGHGTNPAEHEGVKSPGGGADGWFGNNPSPMRQHWAASAKRKMASAMIAKIPLTLSRHIAAVYFPREFA